jgi:hypothetical protein
MDPDYDLKAGGEGGEAAAGGEGGEAAEGEIVSMDLDALLEEITEAFDGDSAADQDNRTMQIDDMRFRNGEQWPSAVIQEREAANRPVVTINKTGQYIRQVTGDLRKNPPSIRVRPVGGEADEKMARALGGLIRKIEQNSDAAWAYVNAVDHAAAGGIGHWRITTDYAQWDAFDQDICVEAIMDPFAVLWDRLSMRPTREDARHCFVSEWISEEDFAEQYPDATPVSLDDKNISSRMNLHWFGDKSIRVAEYFWKQKEEKIMALIKGGRTIDVTDLDKEAVAMLEPIKIRKTQVDCVYWCKTNGIEILDKPKKFASRYIPIVPVLGEEIHTGDKITRQGLIRPLKDAQRLYNYARSAQTEVIALQPKAPFIGTKKQFGAHWDMWQQANTKNFAALVYDADPLAPGAPQRVQPPVASMALSEMAAMASEDMKATTGIYDASLGNRTNETSGIAIRARQAEGDTGTFIYSDNLARSMKYSAKIILDLIPKIYDTERTLVVLHEDDSVEPVTFNQTVQVNGQNVVLYDVTLGKFDVEVTVGPTYATRRAEAVESMTAFVQTNPAAAGIISDLIAKNSDWPGADVIAKRLRKLIPPQLLEGEETQEEKTAQQQQLPGAGMQGQPVPDGPAPQQGGAQLPPTDAAPAPAAGGPAPDTGPHPADLAVQDAKMGMEAQKIDNDHEYKLGQLEIQRSEVAIKAFLAKLQALEAQHNAGITLRQQDLAEIEALAGQVAPTPSLMDPDAAAEGEVQGIPAAPGASPRMADLIAQVEATMQAVAGLAAQMAEVQRQAAAPKAIQIARDPVTGLMTGAVQVQMAPAEPAYEQQMDVAGQPEDATEQLQDYQQ